MPTTTTSPNMSFPIPIVGVDPGPQYAFDINDALTIIDAHNHAPGSGVPVSTDGISINADLSFNSFNAIDLLSTRYSPQVSPLAGANDKGALYVSGVDLYYNDVTGVQIRITQSGSVTGPAGTITGLAAPASATYVSGTQTFIWQSGVNIAANMDFGGVTFRNLSVSSNGISINAPALIPFDYSLTLPSQSATTLSALSSDATGNLYWINTYDCVVGTSSQVTAGHATHSTIASAITDCPANGTVFLLRGAWTENVTISASINLLGSGYASSVTGNLSIVATDDAVVSGIRFSGNVTLDSTSDGNLVVECFVSNTSVITDNGTGNYIQLTQG